MRRLKKYLLDVFDSPNKRYVVTSRSFIDRGSVDDLTEDEGGSMRDDVIEVTGVGADDTASVVRSRSWKSVTVDTLAYGTAMFFVLNIVWAIVQ